MKKHVFIFGVWIAIGISGLMAWSAVSATADDDDRGFGRHVSREGHYRTRSSASDNEGNETTGQMAGWLLLAANTPVILSLLIKGTNRWSSLRPELKKTLSNVNRRQKKALMGLHYYLNLVVLFIALGHWLSSRCRATALPEVGLMVMIILIALGSLIKFKLCPQPFRKYAYQIHTQPVVSLAMVLVLTVGHLIVH